MTLQIYIVNIIHVFNTIPTRSLTLRGGEGGKMLMSQ